MIPPISPKDKIRLQLIRATYGAALRFPHWKGGELIATQNYLVTFSLNWRYSSPNNHFETYRASVVLSRNFLRLLHLGTTHIPTDTYHCDLTNHVKQPRLQSCVKTATPTATRAERSWHDGAEVSRCGEQLWINSAWIQVQWVESRML